VRADIGMVFQEGALFDSLTVEENVGYKLYEESDIGCEMRTAGGRVLGFVGIKEYIDACRRSSRADSGGAWRLRVRWPPSRDPSVRRGDHRSRPDHGDDVDEEILKLRDLEGVTSIVVTHQLRDAFFVATHEAVREGSSIRITEADSKKADEASSSC
jgi:phospholipid/cholesterol/gamma-HCH transport system ATP-binding protein